MDPLIAKAARKKVKKRRAPPPPNPFTGEVDAPSPPVVQDDEVDLEDCAVIVLIYNLFKASSFVFLNKSYFCVLCYFLPDFSLRADHGLDELFK